MDLSPSAGDNPNGLIPSLESQNNPSPASVSVSPAADHGQPGVSQPAWHANSPDRKPKRSPLTCTTGRARKVRCNGARDICSNCERLGFPCSDDEADPSALSGATPNAYAHDVSYPDESFDALIGRTFDQSFRHVHHIPAFSFLHRASLMERYRSSKVEMALLLALVGITSCIDDAEGFIFAEYNRPTTIKVQALVLIIKHRILTKRSPSAFMLLSIAFPYASALRLNHEAPNLFFLAQQSRRRLMWTLYCVDSGISGGHRDYSLWTADTIHVGLPCNERNFEFDLPQITERLIHNPDTPQVEDVGSLALHIRIQHMRRRIMEFTRRVVLGRNIKADELQSGI